MIRPFRHIILHSFESSELQHFSSGSPAAQHFSTGSPVQHLSMGQHFSTGSPAASLSCHIILHQLLPAARLCGGTSEACPQVVNLTVWVPRQARVKQSRMSSQGVTCGRCTNALRCMSCGSIMLAQCCEATRLHQQPTRNRTNGHRGQQGTFCKNLESNLSSGS
jgi:hypothetical protein